MTRGDLVRVHRGVYREAGAGCDAVTRAFAAAVAAGPGAVPSHLLAGSVHGFWLPPGARAVPAEVRTAARRAPRADLVCRGPAPTADDVVDVGGVVVTRPLVTVRDTARMHGLDAGVLAAESAVRRGLATMEDVAAAGVSDVVARLADPRSQSPLETTIRLRLHDAGITHFVPQVAVWDDDAWCERFIDLADVQHKVGIEGDGHEFHDAPRAIYDDRVRQNTLVNAGWIILRFTWRDVLGRPAYVVATVRQALVARGWRAAA